MQPNNSGPLAPLGGGNGPLQQQPFSQNPFASLNQAPIQPPQRRSSGHFPWLPVAFTITVVLLLGVIGAFVWAYMERQDYKANSDKKVAAAVATAKEQEGAAKDKEFAEKEKSPYDTYKTPAAFGALSITYPKTWSAYVVENPNNSSLPIDAYIHPGFVPGITAGVSYALRVQVIGQNYNQQLKDFDADVKAGRVKITAYQPPLLNGVTGSRIDGEIVKGQRGSVILLPLRDKTIRLSTHAPQFVNDFDNIILANLTFAP